MAQHPGQRDPAARVDWEALESSPEFRELASARRRLLTTLLALTTVAMVIYTILLLTAGDGFLANRFLGITWGLLLVVVMTVLIFVLAAVYSRTSIQKLDPLVERTREMALRRADRPLRDRSGTRNSEI